MSGLKLITAPATEPISTAEAKAFLRIDTATEDTLIDNQIKTARIYCEEYTGRALINQTYEFYLDGFSEIEIRLWEGIKTGADLTYRKPYISLPRSPLSSVTNIYTFDDADNGTVFSSSSYYVDSVSQPGKVVLRKGQTYPTSLRVANAVKITYVAGYGASATDVPEALRIGMREHISYMYEHRGDDALAAGMTVIAKQLYQPFVVMSFSNNPFANSSTGSQILNV